MNWRNHLSKFGMALTVLLAACYPHGVEYANDTDVVFTNYNSGYDFKSKGTFAIPNQIVKITGDVLTGKPAEFLSTAVATPMLNQMIQNMTALGYTKVDIAQSPSLILVPSAMETTTIAYWYSYYGWYWGGYYPGYGYPYYPYYPSYTSYTTGSLIMMLVDPSVTAADGNAVSQWNGAVNGLLTYSFDAGRANRAIDQAFSQSPYLKK